MMRSGGTSLRDLEQRLACLRADLYQTCGTMTVASLESLCRKINVIGLRIYSFKGGNNGKRDKQ